MLHFIISMLKFIRMCARKIMSLFVIITYVQLKMSFKVKENKNIKNKNIF